MPTSSNLNDIMFSCFFFFVGVNNFDALKLVNLVPWYTSTHVPIGFVLIFIFYISNSI